MLMYLVRKYFTACNQISFPQHWSVCQVQVAFTERMRVNEFTDGTDVISPDLLTSVPLMADLRVIHFSFVPCGENRQQPSLLSQKETAFRFSSGLNLVFKVKWLLSGTVTVKWVNSAILARVCDHHSCAARYHMGWVSSVHPAIMCKANLLSQRRGS